jgi:hypothetical protein
MSNRKIITVETGSVWERKKGHGWRRKVVDMYTYKGTEMCYYREDMNDGEGWATESIETVGGIFKFDNNLHACSVSAIKAWGNKTSKENAK